MNFLGKILTWLILVMSIAFLMISVTLFQTHRNWRETADTLNKKVTELTGQNAEFQKEIQDTKHRLQREQVARRFALAALQTKADQFQTQFEEMSRQFSALQAQNGQMTTQIEADSRSLASALDQNSKLRTDLRDSQLNRDQAFDRTVELTDMLHQSQGNLETLEERNQQLIATNARMSQVLDRHNLDEFTPVDGKPPTVDGYVTAVGAKDLLEISIGEDDGLKPGHTLEIFRSNSYLGRVIVRETWPDRAVVQIIPEFRKGSIRKGDRVATKLG
jgi:hypothetical protein